MDGDEGITVPVPFYILFAFQLQLFIPAPHIVEAMTSVRDNEPTFILNEAVIYTDVPPACNAVGSCTFCTSRACRQANNKLARDG